VRAKFCFETLCPDRSLLKLKRLQHRTETNYDMREEDCLNVSYIISEFAWWDQGKPRKSWVRVVGVLGKIGSGYLPSLKL
jgi:hypothetical protein